ncbi:YkvA family protein [Sulfurimonas sp.]|jgi:uncharacterized membrane protein YkvA (DUF1232 family)|uniref:YkvA family protein n=1 Tax=Sulfurimonas sp. TaxID=2022749 RepID=UPI0035671DDF
MGMTKEQEEKARKQFEENIKNVDENDVEYASKKGQSKINEFGNNPPNALIKLWEDVKLMVGLVTDYLKGDYKEVPWNVIASISGAVVYFVSPIDVIPDFIPGFGYLDDALVIKLALGFAKSDLEKYKQWKISK